MPPSYDWQIRGRFGILTVGLNDFLYVRNAQGGYEKATNIPNDFKFDRPVRTFDEVLGVWRTAYWSAILISG